MTYVPRTFPVKVDPGKAYAFGQRPGGVSCELTELGWRAGNELVWWDPGSFGQSRNGTGHGALDIMAPLGAEVVAPRAGRVLGVGEWQYAGERRDGAGYSDDGGWYVRLEADDGGTDYFAHLMQAPAVRSGQRVRVGHVLGYVGQTGNAASTCPHLHYGVRSRGGATIDPTPALTALFNAGDWRLRRKLVPGLLLGGVIVVGLGMAVHHGGRFVQRT